jgi:hypothetical protein
MFVAEKLSIQARSNNSMGVSRKELLSCWLRCSYLPLFPPTSSQPIVPASDQHLTPGPSFYSNDGKQDPVD